jgi:hypothetical protein
MRLEGGSVTTNVIDRRGLKVASDSRWSVWLYGQLVYVDDTGFEKIADRPRATMICAGNALLIQAWKEWFKSPTEELPPTEIDTVNGPDTIVLTVLQKPEFNNLFTNGWYDVFEDAAKFCGTGAEFAKDCYSVNGCSIQCVSTAGQHDPQTGGITKYVEFDSLQSNLPMKTASALEAFEQLKSRGMVLDMKTNTVTPINSSPEAIRNALSAGVSSMSAPSGQPVRPWTEQEKRDVKKAMETVLRLEDPANE